jgi:hypothetical protein
MKFYKYWAQGSATVADVHPWNVRAFGGSDVSTEEALRRANERAARAAAALVNGHSPGSYGYDERPLREEIIEEIRDGNELVAVITRNSYGSLVLNTSRVMFVDVDLYPQTASISLGDALRNIWRSLRGKGAADRLAREEKLLAGFGELSRAQPALGFRVYRTYAGFRLLITSQSYEPASKDALELLTAFGSDPLYIRMCKAQECFRARLSAKHWRCGVRRPPSRFPWQDPAEEREYRAWENEYHRVANGLAVCEMVGSHGPKEIDDSIRIVAQTHDRLTMQSGAKLA